ncbi:MAG: beta-ketoacyl-ACP synthase III [Tepidanaerobacteraceae bacterium]
MKNVGITGIGSYVPEKIVSNFELEKMVDTSDEWIRTRTGISYRRTAEKDVTASDLGTLAGKTALSRAGISPENVDLIIVASATPDMIFPSTACIIQYKIGATRAAAVDIQAGCTGFIYALTCAEQFLIAGMYENVLIIGTEVLSRIVDWEDRNTCVLFGDGAGAAVVSHVEGNGILASILGADGSGSELLTLPAGASKEPASIQTVLNRRHYVKMNGNEVFKFAVKIVEEATLQVAEKAKISLDEITHFIPHQANIRIIDAAIKRLGISKDKVVVNLQNYGNMSSASIPVALDEAYSEGRIKKGDKVVMVGFGAGLTWGANIVEWSMS